mmetsp:Transcript_3487/g.6595  ORF Transcript_3487/g.6595 Transcript_3487/m.6595 type:complete len:683 (-) Transcript_3487:80-2128(-)
MQFLVFTTIFFREENVRHCPLPRITTLLKQERQGQFIQKMERIKRIPVLIQQEKHAVASSNTNARGLGGRVFFLVSLCCVLSVSFIWLSHQDLTFLDNNNIFTEGGSGGDTILGNFDQSISGDDFVEKEYEAAVKKQNEKNTTSEQDGDDDAVAEISNKGFTKSSKSTNKNGDALEKENAQKIKANSTFFVTAGIENYDSLDDESGRRQDQNNDPRRMNVIVLFPDDWRHNSIGSENPIIQTPYLDSLAKEGIRFRQNAVTTAICWQSRATLFSGQWASRHQSYKLKCPHFAKSQAWNQTWPAKLQRHGYHVGHIGKWQYHNDNEGRFDFSSFFEGKHWFRKKGKDIAAEDYARDEAIRFLKERPKEKPFAVTVAFYPPKPVGNSDVPGGQWTPKNETRALYDNITIPEPYNHSIAFRLLPDFLRHQRSAAATRWRFRYRTPHHYQEAMKNIYALITQVDQACKEIVDEIKKQGLYNNTMIIFTVDNGMFNGAHGLAGKWYPYQESIRVPLIVFDPRMPKEKVGTIDDSFTLNVDLAETILGAAGLKPVKGMQGRDISDLYLPKIVNGKTALERKPWREEFFYEFTFLEEDAIPSSKALVRKKWKFIDWYLFNHTMLFDLEKDPLEINDVKDDPANAEIVKEMKVRLKELAESLREPDIGCETGTYFLNAKEATPRFVQPKK